MGIGASVLLIAVGAILTFALNASIGWLDLDVVGWIFMAAASASSPRSMTSRPYMAGLRVGGGPVPRFVKKYADLATALRDAATAYAEDVRGGSFPGPEHTF